MRIGGDDMPTQITNYQCQSCSGPLHYSESSGKLECEYCKSSFTTEEIEKYYKEKDKKASEAMKEEALKKEVAGDGSKWDTSKLSNNWGADAAGMKSYTCPSCGAELLCDATTAATSCPYCGNQSIIPGQFDGGLKPDYVLPFKLSKKEAISALKNHYKKKPLLPKTFSADNHLEEIKGVYVPFWLFDGSVEGSASFDATRSHTRRVGDFEITDVDHFDVRRSGSLSFNKVPVDASSKMPDDYMDSIEPYNYAELKAFSTAYLPGFLADKYDVNIDGSRQRADKRCISSFEKALNDTVIGYETCVKKQSSISIKRGRVYYALLPVWLLSTSWGGKNFLFAMNGQTGKMVGDLPVSKLQALKLYLMTTLPLIIIGILAVLMLVR